MDAAALTLRFAFESVGVNRMEARAAIKNGRGNGALAKIGAVREGIAVGVAAHSVRAVPATWLEAIALYAERHGLVRHVHGHEQPRKHARHERPLPRDDGLDASREQLPIGEDSAWCTQRVSSAG